MGFSPSTLSTLATLTDFPAIPSRVVVARFTASIASFRKTMTRWAAGVVPIHKIIESAASVAERITTRKVKCSLLVCLTCLTV